MDPRVVVGGDFGDLVARLRKRLPAAEVVPATTGAEVVEELRGHRTAVVVIDHDLDDPPALAILRLLREERAPAPPAIFYCLDQARRAELAAQLVDDLGVDRLMFRPVDPDELARQIATASGLEPPVSVPDVERTRRARDAIARIWERASPDVLAQLDVVEEATTGLLSAGLSDDLRRAAAGSAHKLAGSLGTFGFRDSSTYAAELERFLEGASVLDTSTAVRMSGLVLSIRTELERAGGPGGRDGGEHASNVVLVTADENLAARLSSEGAAYDLLFEVASDAGEARHFLARAGPQVVLVDLPGAGDRAASLALVDELSQEPQAAVVTLTEGTIDRVDMVRRGARAFLDRSLQAAQIIEAVQDLMSEARFDVSRVLAVDDNEASLDAVKYLLEVEGVQVHALSDPLSFWEVLEDVAPDLLVLDIDMPHISGIELCRMVRSDARWRTTPVLFLTAHQGPDVIRRVFDAGADDYVSKPIVGPEIVTRVKNRLERVQLFRNLAEVDSLTGVATRRKSSETVENYLRLAARFGQPLSFAVLDLDAFKQVNDAYGHGTGDRVLASVGELLRVHFRGEDVVARWGGAEFAVGMYGMARSDGVRRLGEALETLRRMTFEAPDGSTFGVTFSAGVAQYPGDGNDLRSLYLAADEALARAKRGGRNRVAGALG